MAVSVLEHHLSKGDLARDRVRSPGLDPSTAKTCALFSVGTGGRLAVLLHRSSFGCGRYPFFAFCPDLSVSDGRGGIVLGGEIAPGTGFDPLFHRSQRILV